MSILIAWALASATLSHASGTCPDGYRPATAVEASSGENCVLEQAAPPSVETSAGGGGAGITNGAGSAQPTAAVNESAAGGGSSGSSGGSSCRIPFPSELTQIPFVRHGSFWAKNPENRANPLRHDGNGHAFLPIRQMPAGHKTGFITGPGGRNPGGMIGISWSPELGLEYPVDCAWTVWIAADDDPNPGCNCWTGPMRANPDVPLTVHYYYEPFSDHLLGLDSTRPGAADQAATRAATLRARSCVLKASTKYFVYFAALGDESSQRCSAMLANTGTIGLE